MAEATRTDRYEAPRIEERTDISPPMIGGLVLSSEV
jgi:hypothetical protein